MAKPRQTPPTQPRQNPLKPLNLVSLRCLEWRLGIPRTRLQEIAINADSYYAPRIDEKPPRPFAKKKVKKKLRELDCPRDPLLDVQQRIHRTLLRDLVLPDYICGGVKGHSVLDNLEHHLNASVVVTVDIKSWFPSITAEHVRFVWQTVLKCTKPIADLLTTLTTFNGHLPQGSPTSTALSNLVLYSIDLRIRRAAAMLGVSYSSWVDDLPFSGANSRELIPVVISALKAAGFKVSRSKLIVMGHGKQRLINGLVVGRKATVPKKTRDRMRAALHRLRVGDIAENDREDYIATQKGKIMYYKGVSPRQMKSLAAEFDQLVEEIGSDTQITSL